MKYVNYSLLTALVLLTAVYTGCLSGNALDAGDKLVEMKDYRGALEAYQNVVDTKPGTPDARKAQLAIGALYFKNMKQPTKGVQTYETLIADAPESDETAEAHYELGMYNYRQENYDVAQTQFDTIVNQFPHLAVSHRAQLMLAKSYEGAKKYEKAVEVFDNYAHRNPQSARATQALVNKARIERNYLKNEDDAKQTLQSMVKKYGKLEGAESDIEKAKQELTELNAQIPEPDNPESTQIGRAIIRQQERRERDRPRNTEQSPVLKPKVVLKDSGFGVSAEEVMGSFGGGTAIAGDDQGTYYDAELMVAKFLYQDENYRDAGALYFDAIARAEAEKAKINPYSYLSLSICYRKLGMHKKASEVLKKAASKDSKVVDAVIATGENQYTNGEYEKALETFQSIVGINRNKDVQIYWNIGKTYQKLGEYVKEKEAFERAVALNPEDTDALQSLAEVLHYRLRDSQNAVIFDDLAKQNSNTFVALKTLGDVCYKYGEYNKAQIKYKGAARVAERLLKKTDNKVEKEILKHQHGYGLILASIAVFKQGREADAQSLLDDITSQYPEHALLPYANGEFALLKGDEKLAVEAFKEAIEKNPRSEIAVVALGDYYVSKGYNDEAIALWEGFLEKDKYNAKIRRRLQPLKGSSE